MKYLLLNPQDGQEPGYVAVASDYVAKPGEFVVSEVPAGWVWDAANKRLRPRTDAELLAIAKREKRAEGATRMHRENRALYPEVQEVEGAWVAEAMIDLITEPRGARVASIKANRDRRARFYAAVEAAATVDAVRAVSWEGV